SVTGRSIRWSGEGAGRTWIASRPMTADVLWMEEPNHVWATLDESALITVRTLGRGRIATLGIHPSELRDAGPFGTALVKRLLVFGTPGPVAWLDFERTMVLRMDDPGGAQNIYSRSWCYPKLTVDTWAELGRDLAARQARLSIGYVSAWVDDGDSARGELTL